MIFGNWRPGGLATGARLFGYTDALQLRGGGQAVHALLLLVAILLVARAGGVRWQLRPQSTVAGARSTRSVVRRVAAVGCSPGTC